MPPKRVKSQYWDFVLNNETDESSNSLKMVLTQWNFIIDAAFQHEVAPTTGTKHLQGWLKLDKRQYKSYLLHSVLNEGEWEGKLSFRPARNPKALMAYVQKEQDGAHGYWRKTSYIEETKQSEEMNKARKLIEDAETWHADFKRRNNVENLSFEEYMEWDDGYD